MKASYLYTFLLVVVSSFSYAQTIVKGRVTDAETGEGMPLVNVVIKATGKGTTTDFDGYYQLRTVVAGDTIIAFYAGYAEKLKGVARAPAQRIDFQLTPEASMLEEVTVVLKENPAFEILRNVVKSKPRNDLTSLNAYEYESYTRNEISIDNISQKFRERKMMKKIVRIFDSLQVMAGEDGKPILPVFVSEGLSDYFHRKDPNRTKELIKAVDITGVGLDETNSVSQLIGSSFQQYNFYNNYLSIVNKEFVSPIADGWQGAYNYLLTDSSYLQGNWCYKIEFKPRRIQDLAFTGSMWIADTTYALKQIDVALGKGANLNYIEKIKIQQELVGTTQGAWIPVKTRVLIDVAELTENTPGLLAKFYVSNKHFVINQPKPVSYFDELIELEETADNKGEEYWNSHRHDSLSLTEKEVLQVIDSVKNMPVVKSYVDIVNVAVNGYKKVHTLDVGPYLFLYSNNNVEGNRFRLGARTNIDFSHFWIFKGYGAYGTLDKRFKYSIGVSRILKRKPWTIVSIERKEDYEQVGVPMENIDNNLFLAAVQWGALRGPYFTRQNIFTFQSSLNKDYTQKMVFRTRTFEPHDSFVFSYYDKISSADTVLYRNFSSSEIMIESRYAKDELFVQKDLERVSLGTRKWPIFTLRYTLGIKSLMHSDFDYHRVFVGISHIVRMGALGKIYYDVTAGRMFSKVPYPLLEVHMGNESPYYTSRAFNLMNYFEFISDTYVSLRLRHYYEGFFFNRIPLVKKLKWRFITTENLVYGGVSKTNLSIIPKNEAATQPAFQTLDTKPYVELGYGIENIFKIFRIDFFHRLTYRNLPEARKFGVKFSVQFIL